jgi:hypothetical protein
MKSITVQWAKKSKEIGYELLKSPKYSKKISFKKAERRMGKLRF